jgi:hypothetical protein
MLALQWSLIASAALVYICGYVGRWRRTPLAMSVIYAAMAFVCAYQTFFILTHPSRFREMTLEYAEYAVIPGVSLSIAAHARAVCLACERRNQVCTAPTRTTTDAGDLE